MLHDLRITPEQLKAAADWAAWTADDGADVELAADDRMLVIEQGDDRAAFDTGGEPGSDEYVALAPLDPRGPVVPVHEIADALGVGTDGETISDLSAADQCAAMYELLGRYGVTVA